MEQIEEVKVFEISYKCDKCNVGYYTPNGMHYPTEPPIHIHVCNRCGDTKEFSNQYPKIIFKKLQNITIIEDRWFNWLHNLFKK
jgi:hypothetical protein